MALPPDQTDDAFIREVDEEYRRDQLVGLWKRYGRWLLIALGLFLVALAGWLWWREEQAKQAGALGEEYAQALEKIGAGNAAGAEPTLDKMAKDGPGYRALAGLTRAALAARAGDTAKAADLYAKLAADDDLAEPFRKLASVQEISLRYDSLSPAQAVERLKPLVKPEEPFFATAGEMLAVAYLRQNKPELAGPIFAQIARDEAAPPSLRARAGQMASMLGINILPAGQGSPSEVAR